MRLNEIEKPTKLDLGGLSRNEIIDNDLRNARLKLKKLKFEEYYSSPTDEEEAEFKQQIAEIETLIIQLKKDKFENTDIDGRVKLIVNTIKAKCNKYVNIFNREDKWLYRGLNKTKPAFESESPISRLPKDSQVAATELFDKCLEEMGFEANRSNSIFCTSSQRDAQGYGNVYVIIPENTSCYLWSVTESDIVLTSASFYGLYKMVPRFKKRLEAELKGIENDIFNDTSGKGKINLTKMADFLRKVIQEKCTYKESEQMIPFLTATFPYSMLRTLVPASVDEIDLVKFEEKYAPTNSRLEEALKARHEVLIHGKYIAVESDLFERIKKLL
jgi:hypothetical protein